MFVRVADLLHRSPGHFTEEVTEEEYINSIPLIRAKFLAHVVQGFDLEGALKVDYGVLMTYRGYLKFLELDLAESPLMRGREGSVLSSNQKDRLRRTVAKQMLTNGAVSIFHPVATSYY